MIRPLKSLRFEYHPQPGESLSGALAAGCRDSRLVRIATVLEGGGVAITKPGLVQLADPASIELLAQVMLTDIELINAVAFAATDRRGSIRLGDLLMPRPAFDFVRRRIGPNSLSREPHHRSAWLNRLLPYCPQSFEQLVEDCPRCGPLGWRRTRGIANCETCGKQVPASEQPPLAPALEDDYQLAADLMSRDPAAGQRALARLPSCLLPYSRSALVDVMLKSGVMVSDLPTRWELDRLRTQPSHIIAAVVSAGARLLRAWPTSIQQVVARRMEANADDLNAYVDVRNEVRWISKYAEKEGQAILAMAFPQLDGRTVKTFSSSTRFYTATEVNRRLWTSSVELGELREANAIRFEPLPSRQRLRARYDADDVDELQRQLQAGETPGRTAGRFDLPLYAVSQLVAAKRVTKMDHPGVRVLRGSLIDTASAQALEDDLASFAVKSKAPKGSVSLRYAMVRYAGEKPWARIIGAMLDRKIGYYLPEGEAPEVRKMMVNPADLPVIPAGIEMHDPLGLTHVSLRDAHEILGAAHYEAESAIASAGLAVVPFGKGKGVDRRALNRLASVVAYVGEASASSPLSPIALHHELSGEGVRRVHGGWCRLALADRGLVSRLPLQCPTVEDEFD